MNTKWVRRHPQPWSRQAIKSFFVQIQLRQVAGRERWGEATLRRVGSWTLPTEMFFPHSHPPFPTFFSHQPYVHIFPLPSCVVTPAPCLFLAHFNLLPPAILVASFLLPLPLLYPGHPSQINFSLFKPHLSHFFHFYHLFSVGFSKKKHLFPVGSIRGYFTNCGLAGAGVTLLGKCSTDIWDWSRLKLNSSPPPPIPLTPTMTSLVLLFLICLDLLKLDPSLSCFPQGLLISLQGLLNVILPLCSHCPSSRLHHLSPELFSSLLILHRYLRSISHQTGL